MTEVGRGKKPAEPHIGQQSTLTNYGEAKAKREGKKAMTINNASVTWYVSFVCVHVSSACPLLSM